MINFNTAAFTQKSQWGFHPAIFAVPLLFHLGLFLDLWQITDENVFRFHFIFALVCLILVVFHLGDLLKKPLRAFVLFSILVSLSLTARLHRLDERSFWMDEDELINESLGEIKYTQPIERGSLVAMAARSSILPASHYLTKISLARFGHTVWAARFPSAVFGGFSVGLLFVLLLVLTRSHSVSFLGALLAFCSPYLHFYSQEARPYALGVFALMLFLICLTVHVNFEKKKRSTLSLSFALYGSCLFFLFSMGVQPLMVVVAVLAIILTQGKFRFSAYQATFASIFAALATFGPYQTYLLARAHNFVHVEIAKEKWQTVLPQYLHTVAELFQRQHRIGLVFLFMAVALVFQLLPLKKNKPHALMFLYFSGLAFLFLAGVFSAFAFIINWPLLGRYIMLELIFVFIAGVLAVYVVCLQTSSLLQRFDWPSLNRVRAARLIASMVLMAVVAPALFDFGRYYGQCALPFGWHHKIGWISPRSNWPQFYSLLEKEGKSSDVAVLLDLQSPDRWAPKSFISVSMYYPFLSPEKAPYLDSVWDTKGAHWSPDHLLRCLARASDQSRIILVMPTFGHALKLPFSTIESLKLKMDPKTELDASLWVKFLEVPKGKSGFDAALGFFKEIRPLYGASSLAYQLDMAIVALAVKTKNTESGQQSFAALLEHRHYQHVIEFVAKYKIHFDDFLSKGKVDARNS